MISPDLQIVTRALPKTVIADVRRIAKAEGRTIQVQYARFLEQGVRDHDASKHEVSKGAK